MSLQSQYLVGLDRDVNPTINQCRHNIACPLWDRLSSRNYVTSDKVNFGPDFFKKGIGTPRVCVALKTILSYCTLVNIKHW